MILTRQNENENIFSFTDLLNHARNVIPAELWTRFLKDRIEDHAPKYHAYGVLSHTISVYLAWCELSLRTGVGLHRAHIPLLHDVGKLGSFHLACYLADNGQEPGMGYLGHEVRSAQFAATLRLPEAEVLAIETHDHAYREIDLPQFVERLGSKQALHLWLQLCAADAVGKGWTEFQKTQRPLVAERFRQIQSCTSVPADSKVLDICREAAERWDLPRLADTVAVTFAPSPATRG